MCYCLNIAYGIMNVSAYSRYVHDTIGNIEAITHVPFFGGGNMYRVLRLDTGTLAPVWATSPQTETGSPLETFIAATSKHIYLSASMTAFTVWDGDSINALGSS